MIIEITRLLLGVAIAVFIALATMIMQQERQLDGSRSRGVQLPAPPTGLDCTTCTSASNFHSLIESGRIWLFCLSLFIHLFILGISGIRFPV